MKKILVQNLTNDESFVKFHANGFSAYLGEFA